MANKVMNALKKCTGAFLAATAIFCGGAVIRNNAEDKVAQAFSKGDTDTLITVGAIDNDSQKNVSVDLFHDRKVCPGGMPFGVKMFTDGLLIIGFDEVDCSIGSSSPAKDAGMMLNDIIIKANGQKLSVASDFIDVIENSKGNSVKISYIREKKEYECEITPSFSNSDGKYKTGMWLRDSTAGIGTVTFIEPDSGAFAGLGHGICDSETGVLIPLSHGVTSGVLINSIKRGATGAPGELKGSFNGEKTGNLISNTENGVFGIFTNCDFKKSDTFALGKKEELTEGEAYILCTLDDNKIGKYTVNISEIHYDSDSNKNFIVTVTDKKLISKTGGIVQGMSGSPIIKDGKLVGAITHVLVNDPTKGYGIFVDNMLSHFPESLV
ncbi:MAG: SpoIVB peptidase [Ruminococcaceae bacterium]|nr:SpoIVB peptidase [Oscillospiraceae bacterium]